jgi:cytochrome c-type biogenesis protein CcmH/NrfG
LFSIVSGRSWYSITRDRQIAVAHALGEAGDTNEAIAAYHKLVAKHPGQLNAWVQLGHLYYKSKRYDQAATASPMNSTGRS